MPYVQLNDIELYYEDQGSGPAVVLLAGLASDSQSWLTTSQHLSKQFRVISPDNRCSGRTRPATTAASIEWMADDTAALLNHLHITEATILGHSMGGFIAIAMALRHPHLVGKLILEATASQVSMRNKLMFTTLADFLEEGANRAQWFTNLFFWLFHPSFFENRQMVKAALTLSVDYPYNPSPAAFRTQTECINHFEAADIAAIKAPTLIISGSHDLIFNIDDTQLLTSKLPHAIHVTIPQAGHAIHVDKHQEFIRVVKLFLNQSS